MAIQHTEEIAEVGGIRMVTRGDESLMLMGVVTGGGVHKTLELSEDAARWLVASIRDRREWFASEE